MDPNYTWNVLLCDPEPVLGAGWSCARARVPKTPVNWAELKVGEAEGEEGGRGSAEGPKAVKVRVIGAWESRRLDRTPPTN
jgi:hypothetical protein